MSGTYGGVCYSDPKPRLRPRCMCGTLLDYDEDVCVACFRWLNINKRQVQACRWCGKSFLTYRNCNGLCGPECKQQLWLQDYHSTKEKEAFVRGWTIMGLDIMLEAFRVLYPAPLITPEPLQQMSMWNMLLIPVDGKKPAKRKAVGLARPPLRDNVCNAFTQRDLCADYEDQVEQQWDNMEYTP